MPKINYVLTIFLLLTMGFYIGNKWNQAKPKINEPQPLDYSISLDTTKGILNIKFITSAIIFDTSEGPNENSFKDNFVISKDKYPKLFKQGQANYSNISAKLISNKSNGQFRVELSNNEPDHGDYSASYRLLVDPIMGTVEENTYPRRDDLVSADDKKYLEQYPAISKLIGNASLWKLNKKQIIIGDKKFESVVTVNITASNPQRLFIFDQDSIYLEEKGYEISMGVADNSIIIKYRNNMVGIGDDTTITKVYEFNPIQKTITEIK